MVSSLYNFIYSYHLILPMGKRVNATGLRNLEYYVSVNTWKSMIKNKFSKKIRIRKLYLLYQLNHTCIKASGQLDSFNLICFILSVIAGHISLSYISYHIQFQSEFKYPLNIVVRCDNEFVALWTDGVRDGVDKHLTRPRRLFVKLRFQQILRRFAVSLREWGDFKWMTKNFCIINYILFSGRVK